METCPYDPFSEEVLTDPFPAYAALRESAPLHYFTEHDPPFYTVSRYDDVVGVLMDRVTWGNRYGAGPRFQRGVGFNTDGPGHIAFRREVLTAFGAARIAGMAKEIEILVERLIDEMVAHGPTDFHDAFAAPLPVTVIARMLGIDEADHSQLKQLSDDLISTVMNSTDPVAVGRVTTELDEFWVRQLEPRRAVLATLDEPGPECLGKVVPDDLMSALLLVRLDGRALTEFEISNTLMNLLLGGNETTTSLLTNLLWRLLEVPERWAALLADPALIDSAIEESLRFDAPVLGLFRTSVVPTELHGVEIPVKTKIMVAFGSANRDPEKFSDPDEFRLGRDPNELRHHVAFGRGAHMCPGAALSRLEVRIAMQQLLQRLPGLRLAGPTKRIKTFNFWGRCSLPVSW